MGNQRQILCRVVLLFGLWLLAAPMAFASDSPPDRIDGLDVATAAFSHLDNMQLHIIGVCVWQHGKLIPTVTTTLEVDEYLPDLLVTVYNEAGDDPLEEANAVLDQPSHATGQTAMTAFTGLKAELANGRNSAIRAMTHNSADITKSVDVIGSPVNIIQAHDVTLSHDTTAYFPYFQSDLDSLPGRLGLAEMLEWRTLTIFGPYVGHNFYDFWAYEFPRDMSVTNDNDYKASVAIAMHAADIVTNRNTLHVAKSTSDSCGTNCAVANVIPPEEEKKGEKHHVIWEEVYPKDRNALKVGKSDQLSPSATDLGRVDENAGNGNYVFLLWRHYRGCVQSRGGKLIFSTVAVKPTNKR